MFPVGSRSRNRGRGFAFNRGAKVPPTFAFDFLRGSLDSRITFTRASAGTNFNSAGALVTAATDAPRFDYNPSTLIARGLLIEEARTNSLRNNTMVGASAGTPGTRPTNWQTNGAGLGTLTQTISNVTTTNGISTFDVRLSGTTSTVSYGFRWETDTQIAASNGQVWANSFYVAKVAGATTNITSINSYIEERTGAGGFITSGNGSDLASSLTTTLTRAEQVRTLSGGGTVAVVNGGFLLLFSSGVAIDITLRIGMPQLELGAFATSVISTSTVAVTRAADVASITGANFTSFWNATQGTILANVEKSSASAVGYAFVVSDGTGSNRQRVFLNTDSNQYATVTTGGVEQLTGTNLNLGSWAVNTAKKVVIAYQSNNFAGTSGGAAPATDSTVNLPTVDRLYLGQNENGTGSYLNGWISSLSYYPVAMPTLLRGLSA